jgi:hypothetical protein
MLRIPKASNNKTSMYLVLVLSLFLNYDSNCQNPNESNSLTQPKSTIVMQEASDGSFNEYYFYNYAGKLLKKIRHDQFESKNPIYQLDLPKTSSPEGGDFFEGFTNHSIRENKVKSKTDIDKVVSELKRLANYGMDVKSPEKATVIIGHPNLDQRPLISQPSHKFLIKIETASILDTYAEEPESGGNALLDCSYISVYNYMGIISREILIPDRIVSFASISDDGNFLLCICEYSLSWDEGLTRKPDGVLVVDLQTNKMNFINASETKKPIYAASILFADNYFQMTFGNPWSGEKCNRLYINPYDHSYYIKSYQSDYQKRKKPVFPASSFFQFEGTKERIEDFNSYSY